MSGESCALISSVLTVLATSTLKELCGFITLHLVVSSGFDSVLNFLKSRSNFKSSVGVCSGNCNPPFIVFFSRSSPSTKSKSTELTGATIGEKLVQGSTSFKLSEFFLK